MRLLKDRLFINNLLLFMLANVLLYLFIYFFHFLVPFDNLSYQYNAHHYLVDPRVTGQPFELLSALAQYDAQWYLKIAGSGYNANSMSQSVIDKDQMGALSLAFFPLYPLTLALLNYLFHNLYLTAFILSNLLIVANFTSLYYVIAKIATKQIAIKTAWLVFLFPFSIFYHSYYTEGLQLLLLIWFGYFLYQKQLLLSAIFLTLLNVTKGNTLLLNFVYLYYLWQYQRLTSFKWPKISGLIVLPFTLLALWVGYNYLLTNQPFFFYVVQTAWQVPGSTIPLIENLIRFIIFPYLPLHGYHYSQFDVLIIILAGVLLAKSFAVIPRQLWLISLVLWATPLLTKDSMAFSRLQSISYPLFFFLAIALTTKKYLILSSIFIFWLGIFSLLFVSWYWIG